MYCINAFFIIAVAVVWWNHPTYVLFSLIRPSAQSLRPTPPVRAECGRFSRPPKRNGTNAAGSLYWHYERIQKRHAAFAFNTICATILVRLQSLFNEQRPIPVIINTVVANNHQGIVSQYRNHRLLTCSVNQYLPPVVSITSIISTLHHHWLPAHRHRRLARS